MTTEDRLTRENVTTVLRRQLGDDAECLTLERGPVGHGQETWFLTARTGTGNHDLVLRRTAAAGTLVWTDRKREFEVLRALAGTGLPTPRARWLEPEPAVLGRAFLVMDRMPGTPPARLEGEARTSIASQIGTWLARLHALDPEALRLELERPADAADSVRRELEKWWERYQNVRPEPVPLLEGLFGWLQANIPLGDDPSALLWGDPGPHNVLVAHMEVTGLLDWELAHVGHPLEDLGAAVWSCFGILDPEDVISAYEAERGAPVDRTGLRYFEVFACVNRSIMLLSGVAAFIAGDVVDPSLAGLGLDLLVANLERAAAAAHWPSPTSVSEPSAAESSTEDGISTLHPDASETVSGLASYLLHQILPRLDDRRLRREMKTASALLRTVAMRIQEGPSVAARCRDATAELLTELGRTGEPLGEVARRLEVGQGPAELRRRVRQHLLEDLAEQRMLLHPLRELYGRSTAPPSHDQGPTRGDASP